MLELTLMRIQGAPPRTLGFHVVMLANYVFGKADSLLATGTTQDRVGLQDGVLRYLADWCDLYNQAHADPVAVFQSRLTQEDWLIVRLEDNCGHAGSGVWKLQEQWMAVVDQDTTVTPRTQIWAHEIHLKAAKCVDDTRVIYVDLPNYDAVTTELSKRRKEGKVGNSPLDLPH